MRSIATAFTLALTAGLFAQPSASYTHFGTDCQHTAWPMPTPFVNLTLPRIGTSLRIQTLTSWLGPGSASEVFLLTGVSNTSWGGVPLPFDVGVFIRPGILFCGHVYVSVEISQLMPSVYPPVPVVVDFPIPNQTSLLGARFYQQIMDHRTAPHDNEYFFTRAAVAVIGV